MSQWTHVNASIRFDGLENQLPTEETFGKVCRPDDKNHAHWYSPDLPCGTEGSIDYSIIMNPRQTSIAYMIVVFFGDLRDYKDVDEVLEYFRKITRGSMVRSGVLEINVESRHKQVYSYETKIGEWVEYG